MNLSKSFEFFDPAMCKGRIHIIGCGSVGSTVAELLARFGLTDFVLYDFDMVEPHNLVNQMFTVNDLRKPKTECVRDHLLEINPEIKENIVLQSSGWDGHRLSGYVFLCVDNIDLRRRIVQENMYNQSIKAMFDFRTGLTDAQHYAAEWSSQEQKKSLLATMDFTHEEAEAANPVSACNVSLCVAPTVRMVANIGVTNFVNFVKGERIRQAVMMDAFNFTLEEI